MYKKNEFTFNSNGQGTVFNSLECQIKSSGYVHGDDSETTIILDGDTAYQYFFDVDNNNKLILKIRGDWELGDFTGTLKWIITKLELLKKIFILEHGEETEKREIEKELEKAKKEPKSLERMVQGIAKNVK